MTQEKPTDWNKYRRVGEKRVEAFMRSSELSKSLGEEKIATAWAAFEKEIYDYSKKNQNSDAAQGNMYKDLIRNLEEKRDKDTKAVVQPIEPSILEARDRFLLGSAPASALMAAVAARESTPHPTPGVKSVVATAPTPYAPPSVHPPNKEGAPKDGKQAERDDIVILEEEIVIPPPEGEDVVRQFEELRSAFNLLQKYKGVDMLNLKRKAEDRQRAIDPVWKRAKKQTADEKSLEERKKTLAECEREISEQVQRSETLSVRAKAEEEEDALEHKGKMEGLWALYRSLREENKTLSEESIKLEEELEAKGLL